MSTVILSKTQQELVDLMRKGDVINYNKFDGGSYVLSSYKVVRKSTVRALKRKGVIEHVRHKNPFIEGHYKLSEEWRGEES